jgi:CHASE3 domain sensor protein
MARKRFTGSPITAKQQELSKQEEDLQRKIEDLQRLITEAPQLAKEEQERRRQARVFRSTMRRGPLDGSDVLHDARHEEDKLAERPKRPRRAQRRAARTRLLVMMMAVMVAGSFVLFLVIQLIKHL